MMRKSSRSDLLYSQYNLSYPAHYVLRKYSNSYRRAFLIVKLWHKDPGSYNFSYIDLINSLALLAGHWFITNMAIGLSI